MRSRFAILFVCSALLLPGLICSLHAQVSSGGTPRSLSLAMSSSVPTVTMPSVDFGAMLLEDEQAPKDVPFRFGAPHDVNLSLMNSGNWQRLPNGDRLWRLRITSPGAYSLNLLFDRFALPVGGKLYVYNDDYKYVIGAFTDYNHKPNGVFATQPVPGEAITLEYYEPSEVAGQGELSLMRVVHAYQNLFGREEHSLDGFNDSGNCNNNVVCPEGDLWESEIRSVAMMVTAGGYRFCTGSLVNNTAQDATPLFLTANHCLGGNMSTWVFMFNYESPVCTPNTDGMTNQTVVGASLLFNNSSSDGALLELSLPVPNDYLPYFNGWNAVDEAAESSVGIHHPSGDVKKISFDVDASISSGYFGGGNDHWLISDWEDGTTEGGSSGSPLYDQNHLVTGQLHGGIASCFNNVDDYYGKLSLSFELGMNQYLDPLETGVLQFGGFDPNIAGRVYGLVTNSENLTPLVGVDVEVVGGTQTDTTDQFGEYELPLPDGTFDLRFSQFAYEDVTINDIVITEGSLIELNVGLTPVPSGTLTGTVYAGQMKVVRQAIVRVLDVPLDAALTDESGSFEFTLPGAGTEYNLHVEYAGIVFDTTVTIQTNSTAEVEIYLTSNNSLAEGPDGYGYYVYDRLDYELAPDYEWIEIAPALDGPGELIELEGPDYSHWLPLEESFVFYGQEFDTVTLNENGWIAPGASMHQRNANTAIPNPNGPEGMLAAFWDNLHMGDQSQFCWWYDEEHCRLILEYYQFQFLPNLSETVTFQVQILSPFSFPTPTGDSEILVMYDDIGVLDMSTVGIENIAQDDGVQVLYNGDSGGQSWPVIGGEALLFSTRNDVRPTGVLSASVTIHPDEFDFIDARYFVNCEEFPSDPSGAMTTDEAWVGEQQIRVELEGYETWASPVEIDESTPASVEFELWRLDPPRNLYFESEGTETGLLGWEAPLSLAEGEDHFVEYIVERNGTEVERTTDLSFGVTPVISEINEYAVSTQYLGGLSEPSNSVEVDWTAANDSPGLPTAFSLGRAFPNPFNATATIRYAIPQESHVKLTVFDVLGREVATLLNRSVQAGYHRLEWNANAISTGVYFVRMETTNYQAVSKLLLLK